LNKESFDVYLKDRYNSSIAWYDKKSSKNKKVYYSLQIAMIVLAAITPVLAVIEQKWLTVLTASAVTILASLLKFGKFEENWINYRTICETLKKEQFLYQASLGDYSRSENKEQIFVDRVESLISRENTLWMSISSTKEKKSGT